MNETLKFSWGHIIAFVAIIIIGYFTFMGATYFSGGNMWAGVTVMVLCCALIALEFIGIQALKATGRRFARRMTYERILVFASPLILLILLLPMLHFFTVNSREKVVVETFRTSIADARSLFDDYDAYANARIDAYSKGLDRVIARRNIDPSTYRRAGFKGINDKAQADNMVESLRTRLLSDNTVKLSKAANQWITDASDGAGTWNVFLIGNTRSIEDAINGWNDRLNALSARKMSNEDVVVGTVQPFVSNGAQNAIAGIARLNDSFAETGIPGFLGFVLLPVFFIMCILPYLIQDRHSRSTLTLTGRHRAVSVDADMPPAVPKFDDRPSEPAKAAKRKDAGKTASGFKEDERYRSF